MCRVNFHYLIHATIARPPSARPHDMRSSCNTTMSSPPPAAQLEDPSDAIIGVAPTADEAAADPPVDMDVDLAPSPPDDVGLDLDLDEDEDVVPCRPPLFGTHTSLRPSTFARLR